MPRFLDLLCGSPAERCDSERRAQMAALIPAAAGIVSIVCDIKQTQVNSSARRVRASS